MNGVFFLVNGDVRQETNALARASVMPEHRQDEQNDLQASPTRPSPPAFAFRRFNARQQPTEM